VAHALSVPRPDSSGRLLLLLTVFYRDDREVYRFPELDSFPWLLHGFCTRLSQPPPHITTLKQVHSSTCVFAGGRTGVLGEGDALLENTPGSAVAVKTADCVPILLVDPSHRAVAAVHAGWRGTVAEIVRHAIENMSREFASEPAGLHAAIGPAIGPCCYEVGPEVAAHFPEDRLVPAGHGGRAHVDLAAANRRQLLAAGLNAAHIYTAGLCTMCLPGQFHSFRRDKQAAGRVFSFVGLRHAVE
jgi:YfiH family protein